MKRGAWRVGSCSGLFCFMAAGASSADLRAGTFPSPSLGRDVSYVVQLPPGYESAPQPLPVVYVLHGLFEDPGFWEERGLAAIVEEAWASGALPELVVAGVDGGNSFFVNGPAGAWQDLVTEDFVPWLEGSFRVRADRGGRGLLGVSMGGYAALRIALTRPDLFGAVATHSAMLLTGIPSAAGGAGRWHMAAFHGAFGNPIDPALWAASDPIELAHRAPAGALPPLYLDCGASDRYGLAGGHRALGDVLERRGVAHELSLPPGDHGYGFVRGRLQESLGFLARHLETTTSPRGAQR